MNLRIDHSDKNKSNLYFSDHFQRQNRSIVLLTHYREEQPYHERINSVILERLVNLDLENVKWTDLSEMIKDFFLNLNWELYAQFRKYDSNEMGVSVFLAVIEDNKIYFVTSGRFVSGALNEQGLDVIGRKWENFHVKTQEELALIGNAGRDLVVKPINHTLTDNSLFIVLPYDRTEKLRLQDRSYTEVREAVSDDYSIDPFPYCIIYIKHRLRGKKISSFKGKKFRITAIILLLMLFFSIYYLFLGKEAVDDRLHITREQFQLTIRNIDILKLQEIIPLDYGILLVPQRNIELTVEWESLLPYTVTLKPYFCMRNIYLVSDNTLHAYDKRNKKSNWKRTFDRNIISLEILDSNLMLVITDDNANYSLKRDSGETVWQREDDTHDLIYTPAPPYNPVQISLEMDRRLNTSIILMPQSDGLTLINILNGDTLTHYSAGEKITFVSEFDLLEKSIYMIKGDKLYKVRFDIRN